jgi:hypothetical protein
MTIRKKIKLKFLIYLRKIGFICKPERKQKRKFYLSKSIYPDGTVIEYDSPIESVPLNKNSFESELHVYHEMKKDTEIKYGRKKTTPKKTTPKKPINNEKSNMH